MATINNCYIPEEHYYQVDRHIWAFLESDGLVTVGMTDLAQCMAGRIFYVKIRPVGQQVEQFSAVATIESGQFIGSVPAALGGEIRMVNEHLPIQSSLINQDPYGKGWIVRIQPVDLQKQTANLLTGQDAVRAYQEKMCVEISAVEKHGLDRGDALVL